jgi:anti-sigma factor RsiW
MFTSPATQRWTASVRPQEKNVTARIPSWILVIGAVIFAIPFGWGLGVLAAYLIAGSNFGQLPLMTVPLGIAAAVAFAAVPRFNAWTRFAVTAGGTALFILAAYIAP